MSEHRGVAGASPGAGAMPRKNCPVPPACRNRKPKRPASSNGRRPSRKPRPKAETISNQQSRRLSQLELTSPPHPAAGSIIVQRRMRAVTSKRKPALCWSASAIGTKSLRSALPVQLRGLLQLPPGRTERARILRSGYFAILVPDDHSVHGRHLGRDGRDAGAMQHGKQRRSKCLELFG